MLPGRDQVKAMERLARVLAVLCDRSIQGVGAERWFESTEYGGDETLEPPVGSASLLEKLRTATTVHGTITLEARLAARQFVEHGTLIDQDGTFVAFPLALLPPVGERVSLLMLANGTSAGVKSGSVLPGALKYVEVLRQDQSGD